MATNTIDLVLLSALEKLQIEQNIINRFNGLKPIVVDNYDALNSVVNKNNGFYVTLDTNHWYVYQGGAWVDGGVYQERGIGNGEIVKVNLSQELLDYIASQEWVSGNFATEHEAHSLRKEILNLKEEIFGTILDTTTIDIDNEGTIPSTINVEGTDYNVIPKGDVSVLSVEGDTTRCTNLINLPDIASATKNGITCKIENNVLTLSGTATGGNFFITIDPTNSSSFVGEYTFGISTLKTLPQSGLSNVAIYFQRNDGDYDYSRHMTGDKTFITSTYDGALKIFISVNRDVTLNTSFSLYGVKGNVAPTQFQPYFEGLKHTEYKNVTISSPNEFNLTDRGVVENGITYTIKNGVITLNGTSTSYIWIYLGTYDLNGDYFIAQFGSARDRFSIPYKKNGSFFSSIVEGGINLASASYHFNIQIEPNSTFNNDTIKPMLVKGSVAPTSFIPYYSTPILSVPTTLQGVDGYRDTLEVRLNEITEIYDAHKITKCKTITFNGSEAFHQEGTTWSIALNGANTSSTSVVASGLKSVALDSVSTTENSCNLTNGVLTFNIGNRLPIQYFQTNNLVVTFASASTTEEKVANGLDFEQVTALADVGASVTIDHATKEHLSKPKAKVGIVYKKLGSTNLISGGAL